MKKYYANCNCAGREGFTTVLHNHAFVGITTKFRPNGVFLGNMAATAENNYCPQCGVPRRVVEEGVNATGEKP